MTNRCFCSIHQDCVRGAMEFGCSLCATATINDLRDEVRRLQGQDARIAEKNTVDIESGMVLWCSGWLKDKGWPDLANRMESAALIALQQPQAKPAQGNRCKAVLGFGPGHQSRAPCELRGKHSQHAAPRYDLYWTTQKFSTSSDESPEEESKSGEEGKDNG